MSEFDRLFASRTQPGNIFEQYQEDRANRSALRATTALTQRDSFDPVAAARRINLTDQMREETGHEFDPRLITPESEISIQQSLDLRTLHKMARENARVTDFLGTPENMELAYDDLNTMGFWAGIGTSIQYGGDATYDGIRYQTELDRLAIIERGVLDREKSFAEIFADESEEHWEFTTRVDQTLTAYLTSRLGMLFRSESAEETLADVARKREAVLEKIGEGEERRAEISRSVSFDDVSRRMATQPENAGVWESTAFVWGVAKEDPLAFASWLSQTAAESIPSIAVASAATLVTRNPYAGATAQGYASYARSTGSKFTELVRDGGYDLTTAEGRKALLADPATLSIYQDEAATYGLVVGLMDGLSGGLASKTLLDNAAGDFLVQMLVQAAMGSSGEALGSLAIGQDINWTEVLIEGLAELVTGPLEIAGTGGRATLRRGQEIQRTQARRRVFEAMSAASTNSKLRQRVPAKYREMVDSVTKDGPVENIYVNPEDINEMFQSIEGTTVEEFFDALPDLDPAVVQRAMESGTDIAIPTAVYAAHIVGSQFEAPLQNHIRFGPMELSMAEAQNLTKELKTSVAEIEKNVTEVRDRVADLSSSSLEMYERMVSELQAAGRSPEVAAREALPFAKFLETRSERSGTPIEELASRFALPLIRDRGEAARVTTAPRVGVDSIMSAVTAPPVSTEPRDVALVRDMLDDAGLDVTPENVRTALLSAAADDRLSGELEDALLMRPEDIERTDGDELMQTVTLRNGKENLKEWGLDVPLKTRELAVRLQRRQRKKYGKINPKQRGPKSIEKMANWMADEIEFEMQTPDKSAKGWYGHKFQRALDRIAELFPELMSQEALDARPEKIIGIETVEDARAFMTMLLAVTSNGAKVQDNYRMAVRLYREYRANGDIDLEAFKGNLRTGDMVLKLGRVLDLRKNFWTQFDVQPDDPSVTFGELKDYLLEEMTVKELNAELKKRGENPTSGMPADMIVSRSALIFGPKLGAFYANLSGADGYLTMDLWWTRTINRYRGDLIPTVSGLRNDPVTSKGDPKGLARFKALVKRPDLTDRQALNYATEYAQRYKDRNYKNGTDAERAANTLYKQAFVQLNEQPTGAADRAFMRQVAEAARAEVQDRTGEELSIADVQAMMWYYEKRLYADMGVRDSGDISYEEAADRVVEQELAKLRLPNLEAASPGPVQGIRSVATKYMRSAGLPVRHQAAYAKVDPERAAKIAEAYDAMEDTPNDPEVRAAYQALADETLAQYEALKELGYTFSFIRGDDPYDTPRDAIIDMQENKHLWVFPTSEGFGTNTEADKDHPLLQPTGITIDGVDTVVNDIFRIVHDVFGHGAEGASFGARGEENAWQAHVRMFSPLAARAMTTETRGQNSWVNFGPYGEQNRSNPSETVFADQKTGLLPEWVSDVGQVEDRNPLEFFQLATDMFGKPLVTSMADFADLGSDAFDAEGWFIVSATHEVFGERADELQERLDALGLEYEKLEGVYKGEPDGASFMVVGPRWQGLALGQEFDQESVLTGRGLEYTDGSKRKPVPFDGVITGERATQSEFHSIRIGDQKPFSLNLQWPDVVLPGLVDGKYYGIPLEDDGTLRMVHWSDERRETLDPEFAGTGPLKGAERNRRGVKGVYFGLNIGGVNGYKKESLGPHQHVVYADPTEFYPFYEDPEGLRAKIPDNVPHAQRVGAYEELIEKAGYKGYVTSSGPLGQVAVSFVAQTPDPDWQVMNQSTEFANWFGDSQAVDEDGNPLVMYHGTGAYFRSFDTAALGSVTDAADAYEGFWVTTDEKRAWFARSDAMSASGNNDAPNPLELYVKIENPLIVDKPISDFFPSESAELIREAKDKGHDGVMFMVGEGDGSDFVFFEPTQVKHVQNNGDFNPDDPNIFNQEKRGSIILPPGEGQTEINLFEKANLSTVLHEGGHYFLWVLQNLAENGDTSSAAEMSVLNDWWLRNAAAVAKDGGVSENVVRTFLAKGTTGDADLDAMVNRGLHEQFARGFEAYVLEGKAPSNALRAAFESFAAWMMAIYKTVRGLNIEIDNEVRGVFDRMLATDAELNDVRAEQSIDEEVARIAKEMGLDENAYARLIELSNEARDEAKQLALKDVMEPIFRERRKEVKQARAEAAERVSKEVMNRKHNRVIQWLGNQKWVGGDAPENVPMELRLDVAMLKEDYPDIDIAQLPRGRRPLYAKDTMLQADEVAEWFGYASGADMLEDLITAPKAADEIKARVDAEINERFADALQDGSVEQQAVDALHGDKRGQVIVAELRAINRVANRKNVMTSRQQAAAIARDLITRTDARTATRSASYLAAERRYAEKATRALAAGDTDAAFEAKRKQLINHSLYIESRKAADTVAKLERLTGRLRKKSTRKNLAGEYLDAIDSILDTYNFRRTSAKADMRRENLMAYIDMMKREGRENELAIPAHVLSQAEPVPYKTLNMQRLQGVYDSLKNIEHTARFKKKLRDAAEERDFDATVADIEAAFDANIDGKPPKRFPTGFDKFVDGATEYVNLVLNADTVLRMIDGWQIGDAVKHLKTRVDMAETQAMEMREKAAIDFDMIYGRYSRRERAQMAVKRKINGFPEAMSKWDILSVALNTGNKDNYERLTSTSAAARFTPEQVDALLATLEERDWRFVQDVWDNINGYWEQISAREKRTTGVTPQKVEAGMQVTAPDFVKGGYYPIKYNSELSSKVADEQAQELFTNMQQGRFGKAQTRDGHLKERAAGGGGRTLDLGMHVYHAHIQSVIHDLAFSEPVNATWKLLRDPRIRAKFEQNGMLKQHRSLEVWIQDVATGQIMTTGVLGAMARRAKSGFTVSKLAFNMSTVAIQITGVAQSMALLGSKNMARGIGKYVAGGAFLPGGVADKVRERSAFMRERETTFQRDVYDMLNQTSTGPQMSVIAEGKDLLIRAGFYTMQKVQFYTVDMPTWLSAYEKAIDEGKSDADAAYEADRMVARAQASGLFADRSAIERGSMTPTQRQNDFVRLFTALGSYMFTKLNVATEVVGRTDFRSPTQIVKMLMDMALLFTLEAVMYNAIKGTLPGMGEDDEDDPTWGWFLARETALSAMGTMPFLRDMASAAQNFGGGGAYAGVIETMTGPLGFFDGEMTMSDVRSAIDSLGLAVPGVPSTAINRIIKAEEARAAGDEVSPVAYIMGLPR